MTDPRNETAPAVARGGGRYNAPDRRVQDTAEPTDVQRYSLLWRWKLCLLAATDPRARDQHALLQVVADTVDARTGAGFWAVASLAERAGIRERACRAGLGVLRDAGYLERQRSRGGLPSATARYRLTWPSSPQQVATGSPLPVQTGSTPPVSSDCESTEPAVDCRTTGSPLPENRQSTAGDPAFDPALHPEKASVPTGTAARAASAATTGGQNTEAAEVEATARSEARKSSHQDSDPKATARLDATATPDASTACWREGIAALVAQGNAEPAARALLGRIVKVAGPDRTLALVRQAKSEGIVDLRAWLVAASKHTGRKVPKRAPIVAVSEADAEASLRRAGL